MSLAPLPIDACLPAIAERLRAAGALVLVAEPGAGKTTRVAPHLLNAGVVDGAAVMLQPRRVAARASAERIAHEQGWRLGDEVGYHVRHERRIGPRTRLRVLTEGILVRQLVDDPALDGVGLVVLDEFHERSLSVDVALALVAEARAALRPDLKVLVMSATLVAEPVARFLGDAPIVRVSGRAFPVEVNYRSGDGRAVEYRTADAVRAALREDGGDVLAFLPGAGEIARCAAELGGVDADVLPLHGSLPFAQQQAALRPGARRRAVLATNVAETSLTIDGVTLVVDGGLARVPRFDAARGLDRLEVERISRASADQRAGRAGRTGTGRCVRLWGAAEKLDDFELPEVRRLDLAGVVLDLHAWGVADARQFGWFEPPDEERLQAAERLLRLLGALDEGGRLTPLGRQLQRVPAPPRVARFLIEASRAGARDAALVAALLAERDPLRGDPPDVETDSDALLRLDLLKRRDGRLDPAGASAITRAAEQFERAVPPSRASAPDADVALRHAMLVAYPDRLCKRRAADPTRAAMVGGGGSRQHFSSRVRRGELYVALDARRDGGEATVFSATRVERAWLDELLPEFATASDALAFDADAGRVRATRVVRFLDLVLEEHPGGRPDPTAAGRVLFDALRPRAAELVERDEHASKLLARLRFARSAVPEQAWPEATPDALLEAACAGKAAVADLRFADAFDALLDWPTRRRLDDAAPEAIEVPTGSHVRLDYGNAATAPVLAVRLQELFGLAETPRVGLGRVPVLLHLLGPNHKPVQVTSDLASFWRSGYALVRKDLRARYPKHAWPDDPTTAPPQRGARRRT